MKEPNNSRSWRLLMLCCLAFVMLFQYAHGQTLPANFSRVQVATGLTGATAMAFTPDNRILVCQKGGQLRVIKNGSLLATPAISLSVNTSGERGLIGVAVDPNFATNNYIYLHYTHTSGPHNRVSRFTLGSNDLATGETAILDLPTLSGIYHNGGGLAFGLDGKLFVAVGENQVGSNSQNLDNYLGKILRINTDGSVPSGNPFTGNAARSRIWVYGLRNPFTISVDPVSGRLLVNDVGNATWEEINDATTGGLNFGWPTKEGMCTSGCTGFTNPLYVYATNRNDPPPNGQGCAINGGTFFNGAISNYPSTYNGKYFFLDYCGSWIDYITPTSGASRTSFGTGLSADNVGIKQGPDGNLYYLRIGNSTLYKIVYAGGTSAPIITTQPANQVAPVGGSATFSVTATGSPAPTYQWRKGTTNIAGATSASYTINNVQTSNAGTYNVVVTNTVGSVTSNNATLTVSQPPTATITSPANGTLFRSGDEISFSGTGSDPEDGAIPVAKFKWWIAFHHATHTHPGPQVPNGVSGASFVADLAEHNETNVWYRIYLSVEDSQGVIDTSYVEVFPITSNLTLATVPTGLQVTLDAVPFTSPYTTEAVSGMERQVSAISPQTLNGVTYVFDHWSQGGSAAQAVTLGDNDTTFTAHFRVAPAPINLTPTNDAYVRDGTNAAITHGTTDPTLLITKVSPAGQLNNARETYLLFDATSITGNIDNVTLKVYGKVDGTAVPSVLTGVYSVANTTWSESTLTWNNKPVTGATELATAAVGNAAYAYISFDVTNYVKTEIAAGRKKISFALKSLTAHDPRVFWNSKEFGSNAPQLAFIVQGGNSSPTVSITSPVNNATFTAPASITINATAADADGDVTLVEFFNGATKLGEDDTAPYTFTWSNVAAGSYALTAKATDDSSATTTSAPVNITVGSAPPCTPVTASADDGNVAANVLDNDLNTRWSASGDGQWIQFCLANPASVTGVQIAFYNGNVRTSTFDVLVGNDGNTWTTAASGLVSSGTSTALETFTFTPVSGKYVRIVGHGNSVNLWNSYTEVKIQTGTGGGGTFTLTPEADAYVRDGTNAAITHGTTDPTLLITKLSPSGQLNNARESYLRFDLASVSGTVSSATLRVYGKVDLTTVPSVPVGVYAVANTTWSESALTWNNKPASGAGLDTSTVTNTAYAYINWDVTSYVQAELAASRSKVSFAMKSLTAHDPRVFWNSKEFGSNAPQLVVQTATGLQNKAQKPLTLELDAPAVEKLRLSTYPNPFRGNTTITFHLDKTSQTSVAVYDVTGRRIAVLVNNMLRAGNHKVIFAPGAQTAGVYFIQVTIDGKVTTKKLLRE
jgi:glucose/arabinose dehydrogenase